MKVQSTRISDAMNAEQFVIYDRKYSILSKFKIVEDFEERRNYRRKMKHLAKMVLASFEVKIVVFEYFKYKFETGGLSAANYGARDSVESNDQIGWMVYNIRAEIANNLIESLSRKSRAGSGNTFGFLVSQSGIGSFNLALGPSIWHWVLQSGIGSFNLALGPSIWHWVLQSGIGSFNLALGPSIWLFGSLNLAVDLSIWLWISQSGCGSLNLAVDLSIWLWISQSGCGSLNLAVDLSIWLWISQSGCGSLNLTLSHSIWHWTTGGTKFRGLEDSNLADGTKIQGLEDANGSLREFQTPWI
ncbi:hypothetical protein WH47_12553 [Habropoda laboriosa]|uniref:Uncharacterized protein n=1 Tax=Habropoda laboriosa TaxID=597456 RepID=A0A0L7R0C4_9HYME|nr:hypothetical protein WH47_12553 [Habropoda laboriosa]